MELAEERAAYLALALVPGIGPSRMATLLEHCTTANGALSAPFAFLCTIRGISPAAATAIVNASLDAGRRTLEEAAALGARILIPGDPEFPPILRQVPDAPTLLFALGDLQRLTIPAVAIVGSRDHSSYGAEVCREVAAASATAGLAVVSGMARGLDAVAHSAALDAGGTTIGILGNGLGVIYPAANRSLYQRVAAEGLLLTEFPPGERPGVGSFPRRNRLISALARVTVVVEAAEGSGTLITVGTALAQGKDVMAVPGMITSPTSVGTNRLIRDGAEPLLVIDDLLRHYPECEPTGEVARRKADATPAEAIPPVPSRGSARGRAPQRDPSAAPAVAIPADLTAAERRLAESLRPGPLGIDALVAAAGLPVAAVLSALSMLELRGLASQSAGLVGWGVEGRGSCAKLS